MNFGGVRAMRRPAPLLLWGAALGLVPAALSGQAVTGAVAEQLSLSPVAGAVVELLVEDVAGSWVPVTSSATDASGSFRLSAPRAGVYRVRAELAGASSPLSDTVTLVGEGSTTEVALLLPSLLLRSAMLCHGEAASSARVEHGADGVEFALKIGIEIRLNDSKRQSPALAHGFDPAAHQRTAHGARADKGNRWCV
jgi:hypothetical protein